MPKRQGTELHADMDLSNEALARTEPDESSASATRASEDVLRQRVKSRAKRRKPKQRKVVSEPQAAPKIMLDPFSNDDDGSDPFAAFGDIPDNSNKNNASSSSSSDGANLFGDANNFGSSSSNSSSGTKRKKTAAGGDDRSGSEDNAYLRTMKKLNKTFKNSILDLMKTASDGDWTIQMMEYIQYAKDVKKSKAASSGKKKKKQVEFTTDPITKPRLQRRVTPYPIGHDSSNNHDDDDDAGASASASTNDGNDNKDNSAANDSSAGMAGNDGGSDIFGDMTGAHIGGASGTVDIFGDAATSDIFGSNSGGVGDIFGNSSDNAAASFVLSGPDPEPEEEAEPAEEPSKKGSVEKSDDAEKGVVHKLRCALYKFKDELNKEGEPTGKKAWTKYGVGDVLIKENGDGNDKKHQLLMYNDATGKLFINMFLDANTATTLSKKALILQIFYPDEDNSKGAWLNTMLKCKNPEIAQAFSDAIDKYKKSD